MHNNNEIPEYIFTTLEKAGYEKREYQIYAINKILENLKMGINVELNLPPGTGKTIISQIVSVIYQKEIKKDKKILFLLPTKILLYQHFLVYESWAYNKNYLCKPLLLDSNWFNNKRIYHQQKLHESSILFSLPQVFRNNIGIRIPYSILHEIELLIIDEYDVFTIEVMRSYGIHNIFSKTFENLLHEFKINNKQFLILSATPIK